MAKLKEWFENKIKISALVSLESPDRFTTVTDVIHGFLDEIPTDRNISIDGKKYWCIGDIEEYSEEKNKAYEEIGIFFQQCLKEELDKEILSEIKTHYGKKEN